MPNARDSLESAASFVGAGLRPGRPDAEPPGERANRAIAEEKRLAEWAQQNGKLNGSLPPDVKGGYEHTAAFDAETQRWIKSTRPGRFGEILVRGYALDSNTGKWRESPDKVGATASEYLDRISLANDVFHDDIRLERVVPADGGLSIVTSQPHIAGEPADPGMIEKFMAENGFEKIDSGMFYSADRQLLVSDLFPKNVVISKGNVLPIDPIIQRADADFSAFLKKHRI
jgi:hypothetical protein